MSSRLPIGVATRNNMPTAPLYRLAARPDGARTQWPGQSRLITRLGDHLRRNGIGPETVSAEISPPGQGTKTAMRLDAIALTQWFCTKFTITRFLVQSPKVEM